MDLTPAQLADKLRALLQLAPGESLYGVVDGAQDLELAYEAKCLYGQEIRSLFEGDMAPAVAEVAPYLVPIDPDGGYLENWARRWGKNAGILLTTSAAVDVLQRHLRDIFVVQDEQGQSYFFRYYDPRALGPFLSGLPARQRRTYLGPVTTVLIEGDKRGTSLRFVNESDGVRRECIDIETVNTRKSRLFQTPALEQVR